MENQRIFFPAQHQMLGVGSTKLPAGLSRLDVLQCRKWRSDPPSSSLSLEAKHHGLLLIAKS